MVLVVPPAPWSRARTTARRTLLIMWGYWSKDSRQPSTREGGAFTSITTRPEPREPCLSCFWIVRPRSSWRNSLADKGGDGGSRRACDEATDSDHGSCRTFTTRNVWRPRSLWRCRLAVKRRHRAAAAAKANGYVAFPRAPGSRPIWKSLCARATTAAPNDARAPVSNCSDLPKAHTGTPGLTKVRAAAPASTGILPRRTVSLGCIAVARWQDRRRKQLLWGGETHSSRGTCKFP
mmetsp:Transcript_30199/g.83057  ORF Transcript_30199/g.83057 Transcript_30199/m.83057 type:complete len:235 (+) Transcript_30199:495-1199(+)